MVGTALALAVSAALQAATPSPGPVARVNGWSIFDNQGRCSALTSYEGGVLVIISYDYGRNYAWFWVANPAWESIQEDAVYTMSLSFNNGSNYENLQARGFRWDLQDSRVTGIRMGLNADDFLEDFALAGSARLRIGEVRVEQLSLSGTRQVMLRLMRCAIDSHRRYPPDPFADRAPASPPPASQIARPPQRARANLSSYFSSDDYPAPALRAREEGAVGFRVAIGADGRITDCSITASSGSESLDSATCRILRARARYTPARDTNGNATVGTDSGRITWSLPVE